MFLSALLTSFKKTNLRQPSVIYFLEQSTGHYGYINSLDQAFTEMQGFTSRHEFTARNPLEEVNYSCRQVA
jgi:hypothetical protein